MKIYIMLLNLFLSFVVFSQEKKGITFSDLQKEFESDATINNYRLIISSEIHWNKYNNARQLAILKSLIQKHRINTIMLEGSYAFAYWINLFLSNGDTLLLKQVLNYYNESEYRYDFRKKVFLGKYIDAYQFYTRLKTLIDSTHSKITVLGVDLEYINWPTQATIWSFVKYTEIVANTGVKHKLEQNISNAKKLLIEKNNHIHTFKKWFRQLEKTINNIGIQDEFLKNYIVNVSQSIPFVRGSKMNYREKKLYENFYRYTSDTARIYGQFGLPHVVLRKGKRTALRSFVSMLNQDSLYKEKILSIGLVCYNCQMADFQVKNYYAPFLTKEEFERLTPFFKTLPNNTLVDFRYSSEPVKDYVQMLLIVKEK